MAFTLATFNVLNRLDPEGIARDLLGPEPNDEAMIRAAVEASERLYRAKIAATAAAVRRLDADVIAFQEVHGIAVLDEIRALLPAREGIPHGGYMPAIAGPADRRGIACGVLTRLPVRDMTVHTGEKLSFPVLVEGDPEPFASRLTTRRGVLEVVLMLADGSPLHLLVVHFKSKLPSPLARPDGTAHPIVTMRDLVEGQVRSEVIRVAEALHLRSVVDRRLDEDPGVQLAVAGDFNDTPDSLTVRVVAGDATNAMRAAYFQALRGEPEPRAGRALHSCIGGVASARKQTIEWRGVPETIDHLLVSDALWSRFHGALVQNEQLSAISAALGNNVETALESDHAPLLASFV
jgi:endonuclease/exonuclease/phosphatase family metal-dependent hydrolase